MEDQTESKKFMNILFHTENPFPEKFLDSYAPSLFINRLHLYIPHFLSLPGFL